MFEWYIPQMKLDHLPTYLAKDMTKLEFEPNQIIPEKKS